MDMMIFFFSTHARVFFFKKLVYISMRAPNDTPPRQAEHASAQREWEGKLGEGQRERDLLLKEARYVIYVGVCKYMYMYVYL